MNIRFPKIVKLCLISLYLIFLAGSVVRMTGSGMGCPDWPKCFGYYVPPITEGQLLWHPNHQYKKGVVIIKDKILLVAQTDFKTTLNYDETNWKPYEKHSYAKFNVFHTWTEYINRLASVLSGFFFLFLIVGSIKFWKKKKIITILSFLAFLLMLFEAWLGKTVVDSVLSPSIITVHMVVGLIIVAILLKLTHLVDNDKRVAKKTDKLFTNILWLATIFSLIQIALGTQVRQYVDEQVKLLGFENKALSLLAPDLKFYIHRSFTILIVLVNFWLYYRNKKLGLNFKRLNWILILLVIEALSGVLMYYVDFPIGTQTIHLLFGVFLFSIQFYLILESVNDLKTDS
ncbi:COX15/CtaA family protein [Urechidicola croceus]|uniref:Heme A synthase n=1 Tax=Urechidicola croceus TaxID=1850246 RepID=A0A1D8P8F8_9FLAO|nr:COX15/CtaA family protein [Urechidicola croceus]AOW20864.1 heme A synthase [Urechidicola croceus]